MSDIKNDTHREKKLGRERDAASDPNRRLDPKYLEHQDLAENKDNHFHEAMNPVQHPT